MKHLEPHSKHALLSPCGLYRYWLLRRWGNGKRHACFIMLNPSTADEFVDDPTVLRCIAFARSWGCDGLEVVNLFALRSPNPRDLRDSAEAGIDPIGPGNDDQIIESVRRAPIVVAAWGAHPYARSRAAAVMRLPGVADRLGCLGTTKDGSPRHPLYLRAGTDLRPFCAQEPAP